MKKLLLVLAVVVATASFANAQDKKWNIGFGAGIASPMGSDFKEFAQIGADYYLNCTYNFTPKLSAGIEYNGASMVGVSLSDDANAPDLTATKSSAFLLKGIYYFTESTVRPYGALMTGIYSLKGGAVGMGNIADALNGNINSLSDSKTNFGFGAELGLKIKWFNLGVSYHNAGKVGDLSIAYMQYNLGFNIGF